MGQNGQQMQKKTADTVADLLQRSKPRLQEVLPQHVSADRLARIATSSIRKTPALQKCNPMSLMSCIMASAQLGLEPDNGLGHAYLVPFKQEANLIIGYKGLVELARRSGQVSTIYAYCVHVDDEFHYQLGLNPDLQHKPAGKAIPNERDKACEAIRCVYAVCKLRDGGVQFDVMSLDEIEAIRQRSRAGNSGPWVTDYPEMAKKTVLRRLSKLLPMQVEAQRAVARDEQIDAGKQPDYDVDIPTPPEVEAQAEPDPDNATEPPSEPGADDAPDPDDVGGAG